MKRFLNCLLILLTALLLFFIGLVIYDQVSLRLGTGDTLVEVGSETGASEKNGDEVSDGSASESDRTFHIRTEDEADPANEDIQKDSHDAAGGTEQGLLGDGYIDIDEAPGGYRTGLTFTVLDVGQALSILIECDGMYMLYDGGEPDTSSYVVAYLKDHGIDKLSYMVASHYDSDHISGLIGVLNVFEVERILAPEYETDTEIYQSFMDTLKRTGHEVEHPRVGDEYWLGSARIEVLGPDKEYEAPNNNSIVLKVSYGEDTFLLPGDAEGDEEEWLLSSGFDLEADVLVVGHHGSRTSTSRAFINAVRPGYAIISSGENPYGMPEAGVLVLIKNVGAELFRTDIQGDITGHTDGDGIIWNVSPCNDFSPGEHL